MASLYRPRITTWKLNGKCYDADGNRVTKTTPGAVRVDEGLSETWYGKFTLPNREVRRVRLTTDKKASQQILAKMVVDAKLAEHDLGGRFAEHAKRPLTEHLADYRAFLTAKGNTAKHVGQVVSAITASLAGCGFVRVGDVQPSAVVGYIADLRQPKVGANGKEVPGKGITTANLAQTYLKSFMRWLWKDRRITSDPLIGVNKLANAATDIRRARRDLSVDELRCLIESTRECKRDYRGLTGPDRAVLYSVAVGTGFRAAELASLMPESFDLNTEPPTVRVAAGYAKNRRQAVQPIPPDLAELLREFLERKSAGKPVWVGTWTARSATMIRRDLEEARAAWLSDAQDDRQRAEREASDFMTFCDADGRHADFHALRHSYITLIVRSGASAKVAQELARHSTVALTLGRYAHVGLYDLAGAVNAMPSLTGGPPRPAGILAATGTDDLRLDRALTKTEGIGRVLADCGGLNAASKPTQRSDVFQLENSVSSKKTATPRVKHSS
jgi:integrase